MLTLYPVLKCSLPLIKPNQKEDGGTWRMRTCAPTIAQGEGRSLGELRIGVFSRHPLTIHQERQKTIL